MVKTEDDPLDPTPAADDARVARRDAPSRVRGHGRRRDRASLRRLLRRRQRRPGRARAQAPVPDRGRRRRRLLVDPPRRRRRRRPSLALEHGGARASTTSSTTSPPRCASGCRPSRRRSAPSRRAASRVWLARLLAGEARRSSWGPTARGASNAKAKRELGWTAAVSQLAGRASRPPTHPAPRRRPVASRIRESRSLIDRFVSRSTPLRRQWGMNEIAITGGTGVVGRRTVRDLLAAGHAVTAVTRSDTARPCSSAWARPPSSPTSSSRRTCARRSPARAPSSTCSRTSRGPSAWPTPPPGRRTTGCGARRPGRSRPPRGPPVPGA